MHLVFVIRFLHGNDQDDAVFLRDFHSVADLEAFEGGFGEGGRGLLSVDFATGEIVNETKNQTYHAAAFPPFIQDIIDAGGLLNSLKARGLAE